MRVWVGWSDLGNAMSTEEDLVRLARSAPRDLLLRDLTLTATLLMNGELAAGAERDPIKAQVAKARLHAAMAHELLEGEPRDKVLRGFRDNRWQVFVAPEGLLLALRAVLRFGEPEAGDSSRAGEVLGELILTANDLLGSQGSSEKDQAGHLLRLWWFGRNDQSRYALPRYRIFLTATRDPGAANDFDLDGKFREASGGLSIREFSAHAYPVASAGHQM